MSDNSALQNTPGNTALRHEKITKHSISITDVYLISYLPPSWSSAYTKELKSTSSGFTLPFSAQWRFVSLRINATTTKKREQKLMAKQK